MIVFAECGAAFADHGPRRVGHIKNPHGFVGKTTEAQIGLVFVAAAPQLRTAFRRVATGVSQAQIIYHGNITAAAALQNQSVRAFCQ